MRTFAMATLGSALLLAAVLYGLLATLGQDLPTPETPREMESSMATRILDRDGRRIADLFVEDRVPLHLADVPPEFLHAIIAIEDRRFYDHWGLSVVGILRALKEDLLQGRVTQGGSTITQQLARNLFLDHHRTMKRKIREAILALRIERSFSKDEILELYVNTVYFSDGAYGLAAAARRFFGVAPADLTLPQCALLAGLPGGPAAFSPRHHPAASVRRRNRVLRAMQEMAFIDEATFQAAVAESLVLRASAPTAEPAAYFTERVRQRLLAEHGGASVYHAGLSVETTLDLDLQRVAEEALEHQLQRLEELNHYPYLRGEADAMLAAYGLPPAEELPSPVRLQGAVVALEPASGAVRVLIGGRDFAESRWNRAVQAPRQPASAFKPFIYATAIEQGLRTTDILLDAPVTYTVVGDPPEDSLWSPRNFENTFRGPVTLRFALAKSINVPTARLLDRVGIAPVIKLARQMGIETPLPEVISLATGTGEVHLLDMVSAYGVFANQGIRSAPFSIQRVRDRYGHTLATHQPESRQVLDARTCAIVTNMLCSAMEFGTGRTARTLYGLTGPLAGKTGTNDDYTDAWFIGYTPDLVIGVWIGFDWRISIGAVAGTGALAALPVWAAVMRAAGERYPTRSFPTPPGLVPVRTCRETGALATPECPHPIEDLFVPGTEPTTRCALHAPGEEPQGEFEDIDRQRRPRDPWAVPR